MFDGARLVAVAGPLVGGVFPLAEDEILIGRDESNTLNLEDRAVSRCHCVIRRQDGRLVIRDRESTNRTFVNNKPIEEQELRHLDVLQIGCSRFLFLLGEPDEAESPSEPQFTDDHVLAGSTAVLRPAEASYLHPDRELNKVMPPGRTAQGLKSMLQAASAVSSAGSVSELQRQLMESLGASIPADRGAILLCNGETVEAVYHWGRSQCEIFPVPRKVLGRIFSDHVSVCLNDILAESSDTILSSRINSVLAAPLITGEETSGAIYLDTLNTAVQFDEDHLQLLTGVAGIAAVP